MRTDTLGLNAQADLGRTAHRYPFGYIKMNDLPACRILTLEPRIKQGARIADTVQLRHPILNAEQIQIALAQSLAQVFGTDLLISLA